MYVSYHAKWNEKRRIVVNINNQARIQTASGFTVALERVALMFVIQLAFSEAVRSCIKGSSCSSGEIHKHRRKTCIAGGEVTATAKITAGQKRISGDKLIAASCAPLNNCSHYLAD